MKFFLLIILYFYVTSTTSWCDDDENFQLNFPSDFKIGSASSSYQVEGGWNEDGRSPSIWDTFTHNHPEKIVDQSNGDVSAYSYRFYRDDVKALKYVGFHHYRFSISWSRVLTNGTMVNPKGIKYYNNLIDELLSQNIIPIVTLYHWDLPQHIQDLGGFLNPIIVKYFKHYADILFENFGDRVKKWITFNEPHKFCIDGYGTGAQAPGISLSGIGDYLCAHHVLQAHAAVYHHYKSKYAQMQHGSVGICVVSRSFYLKNKHDDEKLIDDMQNFQLGWFTHPIYSQEGGYPPVMIDRIAIKSQEEGRSSSRLPQMSDEMKNSLLGASDFMALNYYTSRLIDIKSNVEGEVSYETDAGFDFFVDENWQKANTSEWLYSVPRGIYDLLIWIKDHYDNPTIFITENGYSDDGRLNDDHRVKFLKAHLHWISKAIEDKCNIVGYTAWSLIDNFEWNSGYTEKFGLFSVNMKSFNKKRTPKNSAEYLKQLIKSLN